MQPVTGDAHQVANAVAAELGIDEVFAEVLPEDKDSKVGELRSARGHVAERTEPAYET